MKKSNKKKTNMKDTRFARFRRNDRDALKKADITVEELAEKLGISTGVISKLENDSIKGEVPHVNASVIKAYKDEFECSYEYLMGETQQEKPQYLSVATMLPFSMLQSRDIDNLATVFSDPQYGHIYASVFSALLSKPEALKELIYGLLPAFKKIDSVQNDKTLSKSGKDLIINPIRYTYTNMFAEYMEKHFIPEMENTFSMYDDVLAEENAQTETYLSKIPAEPINISMGEGKVTLTPMDKTEEKP